MNKSTAPRNLAFTVLTAAIAGAILFAAHHSRRNTPVAQPQVESHLAAEYSATIPAATPTISESDKRNGITRVKTPDGGLLVTAPNIPKTPRDPRGNPDYATGDWLVDNLGSEPEIITPFLDKDAYGNDIQGPIIENLLSQDPETFEWQPFLAESYEEKPDHVTFVFKLRKEAKFSDGTPVTADDVVFSYNTMMDKDVDDARYKASGSRIESCTRIDDRTVSFKFKDPYFKALETAGGISIIPKHIYEYKTADEYNKRNDLLIGSGPYLFKKENWLRGQKITLVRNDNYWGEKPTFDRLVYVFIQNPQAAFQAFQNGEIDQVGPNPEQWVKFSADPEFKARYTMYKFDRPNSGYGYIGWNEAKSMFADAKTRTALTMLTDRKTMIATIQRGLAHEITGPFSYMTPQCDQSIQPVPFDPKGARKLLKDAGWAFNDENVLVRNGVQFRFDLTIPADLPQYQQVAEFIQTQYAKAGIIMRIAPIEFSVLVEKLDKREFDAAMLGWTGSIEGDPYQIWDSDSIKDKGDDFVAWSNPEADKLIVEGRKEMDDAKRMVIWHKLHKVIADDQPYTFLWIRTATVFIQPRFKNTEPYKTGLNSGDWYVPKGQTRKYQ